MISVGTVNIDTSHPMGFADVMKASDRMAYVGVYNDSFRGDDEVNGFISRYGLKKRCGSIGELADMCDIGFIQGCDWDDHLRCCMPFIEKGKPVFVDKPLVGSLKDCNRVLKLAKNGAVILGASSARYAYEIVDFLNIPIEERGEIVTVYGTSGVDEFNYGIHIIEAIGGLLGDGAERVSFIGRGEADGRYADNYLINFKSGKTAVYSLLTGVWQPFSLTVTTTKTVYTLKINSNKLYEALIEQIYLYMEHKPNLMVSAQSLVQSVKIALAGLKSRKNGGTAELLSELSENDPSYDGKLFCEGYGAASGKMYAL